MEVMKKKKKMEVIAKEQGNGSFSDMIQGTDSRGLELCGENQGGLCL